MEHNFKINKFEDLNQSVETNFFQLVTEKKSIFVILDNIETANSVTQHIHNIIKERHLNSTISQNNKFQVVFKNGSRIHFFINTKNRQPKSFTPDVVIFKLNNYLSDSYKDMIRSCVPTLSRTAGKMYVEESIYDYTVELIK